jgi:hypothetical protein
MRGELAMVSVEAYLLAKYQPFLFESLNPSW